MRLPRHCVPRNDTDARLPRKIAMTLYLQYNCKKCYQIMEHEHLSPLEKQKQDGGRFRE